MGDFNKFDKGRNNHRQNSGRRFESRGDTPRQMFSAVCTQCGKNCEIPFKPVQGRPVYCKDCFKNQKTGFNPSLAPRSLGGDAAERPAPQFNVGSNAGGGISKAQFDALNAKLDKVIALLNAKDQETPKVAAIPESKTKKPSPKKVKAPSKKVTIKKNK